jgi:ABC-type antimicrobial peptide transport system permease subunit
MKTTGAFRERLRSAWVEIAENPGRSLLQALGIMLGVASVLGGFSISDSQRRQAERLFAKVGGIDKLNVFPVELVEEGRPSALKMANLGLRAEDARRGTELDAEAVEGVSIQRAVNTRVRSPWADQERQVTGIGADYLPIQGYRLEQGREFSAHDQERGSAVAILGSEAAQTFFPTGEVVGQTLRVGDVPVTVIGVLEEKVFRFREGQHNQFAWRNRIVAVPSGLVAGRMQGDDYHRLDRVTFRVPKIDDVADFSKQLSALVYSSHRQQRDYRLDDVAKRLERQMSQGDVYNLIFKLSGVLALVGGGMVNVNIQLASLKERVREVGVKMAIGASGGEIFRSFLTEAMLLSVLGGVGGFGVGIGLSWVITKAIGIPLTLAPASFLWAFLLALVFGFLFALYPAWRASRLSPMEALRYE